MRAADYGEALRTGSARGDRRGRCHLRRRLLRPGLPQGGARAARRVASPRPVRRSSSARSARRASSDGRSSLRRLGDRRSSAGILRLGFGLTLSDTHGMKVLNLLALRDAVRGVPVRRRPLRHRADPPRRAQRARDRRDPGDGDRAAAVAHVDREAGAPHAARPREAAAAAGREAAWLARSSRARPARGSCVEGGVVAERGDRDAPSRRAASSATSSSRRGSSTSRSTGSVRSTSGVRRRTTGAPPAVGCSPAAPPRTSRRW